MKYFHILLLASSFVLSACHEAPENKLSDEVSIKFGRLGAVDSDNEKTYTAFLREELDSVPLLTPEEGGFYGFEYTAPTEYEYTTQLIITAPEGVEDGSDEIVSNRIRLGDKAVFEFHPVAHKGVSHEFVLFDEGDPPGLYEIEVLVNGETHTEYKFQVYEQEMLLTN